MVFKWHRWFIPLASRHHLDNSCIQHAVRIIVLHFFRCQLPVHPPVIVNIAKVRQNKTIIFYWQYAHAVTLDDTIGNTNLFFLQKFIPWSLNHCLLFPQVYACNGPQPCFNLSRHVNWLATTVLLSPPHLRTCVPEAGPRLNIKTVLSTYGDFHVKDKTAVRTSYL